MIDQLQELGRTMTNWNLRIDAVRLQQLLAIEKAALTWRDARDLVVELRRQEPDRPVGSRMMVPVGKALDELYNVLPPRVKTMNKCIDCKYCQSLSTASPAHAIRTDLICEHPGLASPIDGKPPQCLEARGTSGGCGPTGQLWTARDLPTPPMPEPPEAA